jgi:hypothetical protein
VAATFLTQIPGPFLLLFPSDGARKLGAVLQVPLQLLIILTGNYNWFNFQVLVLLVLVWASDFVHCQEPDKNIMTSNNEDGSCRHSSRTAYVMSVWQSIWRWGWILLAVMVMVGSAMTMLNFSFHQETMEVIRYPPTHFTLLTP